MMIQAPVENCVGKIPQSLIPIIPRTILFILFQDFIFDQERVAGRFAPGRSHARGAGIEALGASPVPSFLSAAYPWIKALHVVAVVSWMAGLFYLPRLFVYHAERGTPGSELSETFKVMERRLIAAIMRPAMIATWVLGLMLAGIPGVVDWGGSGWIYVKLTAVLALTVVPALAGAAPARLRRRPEPGVGAHLPADERGSDAGAAGDRHHGGGQAVLSQGAACDGRHGGLTRASRCDKGVAMRLVRASGMSSPFPLFPKPPEFPHGFIR